MNNNIKINRANIGDFQAIKELMLTGLKEDPKAFSVDYEDYNDNSNDWWNNYINPYIFSLKDRMFIAFDNNKPVGMIGVLYDYRSRRTHVANIVWFYILNDYRGQGIGKELLQSAINNAKENNMLKITLFVNSQQENAIKIYNKFGFNQNGRLEKELKIGNEYIDTLIFEMILN